MQSPAKLRLARNAAGCGKKARLPPPSEAIFTKAFDLSPNLMAISTIKEGRILYISRNVLKILGYRPSEVIGRTTRELGLYDDYRQRQTVVRSLRKQGWVQNVELSIRGKTGKPRLGLYSAAIVELDKRKVMLSVLVDVTERRQVEKKLRESEQRYRLMVEAIPMLAWHCAADGGLIEANARWYAYTGQTPEQARGNGWMKALHPDDVRRVAKTVRDDVLGGMIYQTEYRIRRASDGEYRWHLARALPVRDGAGQILAWFGAGADIHENKRQEGWLEQRVEERAAALRESEARLQRILDASNDGYWEWDVAADKVFLSGRFREILGITAGNGHTTREEMRGLVHPEDMPRTIETVSRVIRAGANTDHYELEHRQCRPDGGIVWVHARATVTARNAAGRATRVSGVVTDITDRKLLESQIIEAGERERRRIGNDLHDGLAQILAAISYRSDELHEALVAEKNPEAEHAGKIAGHLRDAVGQVRDLATALHPVRPGPEGLMHALENLAAFVQDFFRIDCRFICSRPVWVDDPTVATHLYRIAQEAVQNATKHSGGSCVWILLRRTARLLSLSIRDNGGGISVQAKKPNGLGLGSMQFRAKAIGGTLTIRTLINRGVTVTCAIPIAGAADHGPGRIGRARRGRSPASRQQAPQ